MRAARAITRGKEILEFIRSPKIQKLLLEEAKSGSPPISAISGPLLEKFGTDKDSRDYIKILPVRQFVGMCVRAVLEEHGYRVAQKRVRIYENELFRLGSVYELESEAIKASATKGRDELAEAMFSGLSDLEARRVIRLIEKTHPGLRKKM